MRTSLLFLLPTILLIDCATLEKIPASTCGNGVVDSASEDCDSFPAGNCGAPEAGESACRLLCSPTDPAMACPAGWACSVSGFCREPTGRFENASDPFSAGITAMVVGDFDGDHRKDIFGTTTLGSTPARGRVHYFGTGATVSEIVSVPASLAAPVVRDFDADGRDDIAFGYTFRLATVAIGGIGMLLGQVDRAVVTKVFPTLTRPNFDGRIVRLDAQGGDVPLGAEPQLAIAATKDDKGNRIDVLTSLDANLSQGRIPYEKPLAGAVDTVVGLPAVGHIFDLDANSSCGEVAVATNGAGGPKIQVFSPCRKENTLVTWARNRAPVDVAVNGETSITAVFIGDLDADGHADLVVGGQSGKVYLARSDGHDLGPLVAAPELPDVPLASGDINRDGLNDLVLPTGVLMSRKGPGDGDAGVGKVGYYQLQAPSKRWTTALIADVNRDGLLDVVGASNVVPDIDVLAETTIDESGLIMPPYTISTTAPVTALAVADVDFDSAKDVVFAQKAAASETTELGVAFGRALAMPPETPRIVGRLAGVRQLFADESTLTITTKTPGEKADDIAGMSIALMIPSGDRQPIAPLLFIDGASKRKVTEANLTRVWLVKGLLAAPIVEKNRIDLVALAGGYSSYLASGLDYGDPLFGMWISVDTGKASYATPVEAMPLDGLSAKRDATVQPVFVAADLENDGLSETVSFSEDSTAKGTFLRVLRAAPGSTFDPNDGLLIPDLYPLVGGRADALDVDGDGHVDIVTLLRDRNGIASVGVLFNDGSGGKRPFAQPVIVPLPKASSISDEGIPLDFAQVTVGGVVEDTSTPKRELVIVAPKKVFRVEVRKNREMDVTDATEKLVPRGLSYASSVVSGDFDGDGVEDLAISDQGSIRIVRQKARLP